MKKRIWELDAFRGICILGMVAVHFVYDLVELYQLVLMPYPPLFKLIKNWGGVLFILLSGTCATLGSKSIRRGVIVFGCGMLCTLVTAGIYLLGFYDSSIIIHFGILHCLGICMVAWDLFQRLPNWALGVTGGILILLGFLIQNLRVHTMLLFPLGFVFPGFSSSDYFPLLPNLGYFLVGALLGRTLYRTKKTLLPRVNPRNFPVRFFCFCGRHSLGIYLAHQPILTLFFTATTMILDSLFLLPEVLP